MVRLFRRKLVSLSVSFSPGSVDLVKLHEKADNVTTFACSEIEPDIAVNMNFETWLVFLSKGTVVPGATMAAFSRFIAIRL